jgi:hypothetical protein
MNSHIAVAGLAAVLLCPTLAGATEAFEDLIRSKK